MITKDFIIICLSVRFDRQKGCYMSEFRICFSGTGVGKAVRIRQEDSFSHIVAGSSDICAWSVKAEDDMLGFEIGHSFGCSDEFDDFMYELAVSLPDTVINYYWHSTMSSMSGSYNIGFMDGEYREWDDDEVYPYFGYCVMHDGIAGILKCGDTDTAGFTHVLVNGKEFWLNDLHVDNDNIYFNNAEKGSRVNRGILEEITKAVPDHEIVYENDDFMTGEINIYKATFADGKFSSVWIGDR